MEILIIGGILVALMVVISTTIKRRAALAFEPETIETKQFRIEKPEGFLYPLRDKPEFPFEAFSKTFGERSTRNVWRARIRLRIHDGAKLKKFVSEIKNGDEEFISEKHLDYLPENRRGIIIRTKRSEDEAGYFILRKLLTTGDEIFELKTTILSPYEDEFTPFVCEMMNSFELIDNSSIQ